MAWRPSRTAIGLALTIGLSIGGAIAHLSTSEIDQALQECPIVQDMNNHLAATAVAPSTLTRRIFDILFPYGPAINALLATLYISGPPNLLLALCPPNIDPSSLSIMVAFAVGGLLGDTIFHLLPEIYLGESVPGEAKFVFVDSRKNLLLGVAILVGFLTFVAMDKALRIATGGAGHGHDHETSTSEKEAMTGDGEPQQSIAMTTSADISHGTQSGSQEAKVRSRARPDGEVDITSDAELISMSSSVRRRLWDMPEPDRTARWLAEVLEEQADSGVTQVALWTAYEAAFQDNDEEPMLEATYLIHSASRVFENACAQIIDGQEKKFIIRGVRPRIRKSRKDRGGGSIKSKATDDKTRSGHEQSDLSISSNKTISPSIRLSAYLNLIADFTHNITDGLALSSSFYASPVLGATTTVAVFFHEIPHEIGDFALLIQSGFSKRRAMGSQFVTAIGAFLGTFLGIAIQELGKTVDDGGMMGSSASRGILATGLTWGDLLLPFTAGTFLYVGTVAVIPELLETGSDRKLEVCKTIGQFLAMLVGAGIMLMISWS